MSRAAEEAKGGEAGDIADTFVVLKTGRLVGVRRKDATTMDEILRMIIAGTPSAPGGPT